MSRVWVALAVVALLATGCKSDKGAASSQKLTLSGASTLAPLMTEVARRFE